MTRSFGTIAWIAAALAATVLATAAATAQTDSDRQIAERIAAAYGATVLKTTRGEQDSRPVIFVTLMKDGGLSNDAFQVTTLAVDPATGDLIPQYRTTPTGQELSGAPRRVPSTDDSGTLIRQWSTRPGPH